MITEKGKFSTKMKAKGVKLGNVHTFVSILCFEFVQWKGGGCLAIAMTSETRDPGILDPLNFKSGKGF